ncbi:helitron_like_N domain-containing protein [Trichonephila clavata]|uniref:Helitron_like_N domain-containing protein n=1 Tax=Trichonephila clavata TaxID=2740835 RepID=A0A8X6IAU3_TRICU|nr:helitron_like_N domain-containing protein [Trichonephila clavata]
MAHLRASETVEEQETTRKFIRIGMARLRTAETVQEQGTRRKSNSLQMMQTSISETAQNREVRLEHSNTEQAEQRCKIVQVKQDLVLKLQDMLQRNNSYIKSFKSAIEKLGPDFVIIIYADKVSAGQKSHNRHDLLARVFHGKLKILMNLITKGKIFGVAQCYMYTIEWQKRGLPHAHILVWLQETLNVHKVDDFISAEIPNPEEDTERFNCITTQMVHGPCGIINPFSPCMKNGRCTKRYPRDFLKETQTGRDGYPLYRRRRPEDGGFSTVINVRHSEVVVITSGLCPILPSTLKNILCPYQCGILQFH